VEWGKPHAILPLRLFRRKDFSLAAFITVYRAIGLFGPIFLLPIFLFDVQGRESMDVGFMLMPGSVVMASTSLLAGYLTDRIGGRWPTVFGAACISLAMFLYHDIDAAMTIPRLVFHMILQGIGIAIVMTPVITTGMNAVERQDAGSASWILNVCQRGGGAFAVTMLGSLLHRETIVQHHHLGEVPLLHAPATDAVRRMAEQFGYSEHAAEQASIAGSMHEIGLASSTLAFGHLFLIAAIVSVTAILPALLFSGRRPSPRDR
jgi:predicted MFS family arabinose efflux permease